jgi:hypothetical protein
MQQGSRAHVSFFWRDQGMNELCLTSKTRLCSVAFLFLGLCAFAHTALAQNQEITLSLGGNASQSRSFQSASVQAKAVAHDGSAAPIGLNIGQPAPAFTLADQFGHEQSTSTLEGSKGTILLFFRSADW